MIDFSGIGLYEKKNFLHLDVRPTKLARWRGIKIDRFMQEIVLPRKRVIGRS